MNHKVKAGVATMGKATAVAIMARQITPDGFVQGAGTVPKSTGKFIVKNKVKAAVSAIGPAGATSVAGYKGVQAARKINSAAVRAIATTVTGPKVQIAKNLAVTTGKTIVKHKVEAVVGASGPAGAALVTGFGAVQTARKIFPVAVKVIRPVADKVIGPAGAALVTRYEAVRAAQKIYPGAVQAVSASGPAETALVTGHGAVKAARKIYEVAATSVTAFGVHPSRMHEKIQRGRKKFFRRN